MLKMEHLPAIANIAAQINIDELGTMFESVDADDEKAAEKLGRALFLFLCKNLYLVTDELTELVAVCNGVSVEEVKQLDLIPALKKFVAEVDIRSFFSLLRG